MGILHPAKGLGRSRINGFGLIIKLMSSPPPLQGPNRSPFPPERLAPHFRIHSLAIFVANMDRSLQFYVDQLGFRLIADTHISIGRWVAVAPPDGTAMLVLVTPEPDSQEYKLIGRSRHVVLVAEDVVANFQEWSKRGVQFRRPPQAQAWGGMETSFEDPDGNSLALVGYDAATREFEVQRRAAQELEIAKQVQARLFPQMVPPLPTLDYAGICLQARNVGGDYYDFLDLGLGRLGLVIADIAGKGIAAALLMANLQANLRSQCAIALAQPQRFLQSVNQLFYENTEDGAYATLFFAEYDDHDRRLRYGNCGHWPALLLRNDNTLERLYSTSTVLGLFKEWDCSIGELQLFPGDTLALYTDGISETLNGGGEEFGEQRLAEVLRQHVKLPSQALLTSVVDEVNRFGSHEQQDDITLIIAKCR
jgi:catechol 2,3-dioxygenase-like lactoylglutathione lyase family enzyme